MAARNFSGAYYGVADETSPTGLYVAKLSMKNGVDKVDLKNHTASTVGFTLADDKIDITCSGAVAVKGTGIVPAIAASITLANVTTNSLTQLSKHVFTTAASGAGVVVTGVTLDRENSGYETGDIEAVYHPGVASVSSPVSVT